MAYIPKRGDYVRVARRIGRVHSVQYDKHDDDGKPSKDSKPLYTTVVFISDSMALELETMMASKLSPVTV